MTNQNNKSVNCFVVKGIVCFILSEYLLMNHRQQLGYDRFNDVLMKYRFILFKLFIFVCCCCFYYLFRLSIGIMRTSPSEIFV